MPPRKTTRPGRTRPTAGKNYTATAVHAALLIIFGAVWAWHLTPQANEQEVAQKAGWFFQYYTFAGFTLQLIQYAMALGADLTGKGVLIRLADDISCAAIPMASFITAFYYCLLLSGNIVDSDDVPSWVSPALHTGNFAGLTADMLVSHPHRTFRTSASALCVAISVAYMAFCYYLRQVNGSYPYAFLEKAPEPWGIVASAGILVVGVQVLFVGARKLKERFF